MLRSTQLKGGGDRRSGLTSDIGMQIFIHAPFYPFWNGNVYSVPLYVRVCELLFDFVLQRIIVNIVMSLRRAFEL